MMALGKPLSPIFAKETDAQLRPLLTHNGSPQIQLPQHKEHVWLDSLEASPASVMQMVPGALLKAFASLNLPALLKPVMLAPVGQ